MTAIRPPVLLLVLLLAIVQTSGKPCSRTYHLNVTTLLCVNGQSFLDSKPHANVQFLVVNGTEEAPYPFDLSFFKKMPELVFAAIIYSNLTEITPSALPNSKLNKLGLYNNQITRISPQAWDNIHNLTALDLSHNKLNHLASYQFKSLSSLQELVLSGNLLREITGKELNGLRNLEKLWLDDNNLSKLVGKSVPKMKKLTYLNVSHNDLKHLDELTDFFNKTPNLEDLDLSWNHLNVVSGRPFQNLTSLKYLNLEFNQLKVLGDDSFRSMKLEYLGLSGNGLTSISASAFSNLNCTFLNLENNLLNTTELSRALSGVQYLKQLDLTSNQFKSLPADLFPALEHCLVHLNVSNNQLTELPKLPVFKTIKELDFSGNEITSIFKSQNDIEFFQNFWPRLETLQLYIYLQDNPFTCQPSDVDVLKVFEIINYMCPEYEQYCLRCAHPISLFGRKIIDLPADNSILLSALQGHYPTKSNFIYFLTILMVVFVFLVLLFVFLLLLFVFREKVFRSAHCTGKIRSNEFLARKLVDEDEQVQSNGNPSNKPHKEHKEICLISLDPPKFAYSNEAIDVTKQHSAKNGAAAFEKPDAIQKSDSFFA